MLDAGGVFALMGPTGAGKTTTTAKLAARFVVRHGAEKLALLTTDSYRIGGHEQLRIYGKILGVTVHAVRDVADLRVTLSELRHKHTVLIDTVGMSQRDQAVAEQVEMLCEAGKPVKRLLLLNATSHGDTLNEVVEAYQKRGLDGCILSKIDEAASLGPALDCAIRHQLNVHYLATGQRVPEDLHIANRQYLIHRAFKTRPLSSHWELEESELAFALSSVQNPTRESAVALG
jgi:flagellar biosynthesis protein FlhF